MKIEVKVPSPGESISEVQIASWLVSNGDYVEKDAEIVEIDSDKATLSINADDSGKISIKVEEGETVEVGAVIAEIDTDADGNSSPNEDKQSKEDNSQEETQGDKKSEEKEDNAEKSNSDSDKSTNLEGKSDSEQKENKQNEDGEDDASIKISPLARKLMQEKDLSEDEIMEFFKHEKLLKSDVEYYAENKEKNQAETPKAFNDISEKKTENSRDTHRKKLTPLRKKVAQHLVSVKNETAMLTTFNEVDMKPVMDLRKKYKDKFKETNDVSLGFMSFFTKAATYALKMFPAVNSMIDGDEMVFHDFVDIGIAVSSPKGLMVPVLRNTENMSFADIESEIKKLANKARNNKISLQDLEGGTFTITNGGVFGSMMSTPIINAPQSAILGMHNIVERPIAIEGKVEIRPIMYVALSYDHRVIDGKESVSFLYAIKEMLENPSRLLTKGKSTEEVLLDL